MIFLALAIAAVAVGDVRRSGRWQKSAALLAWAAAGTVVGFVAGTPFFFVEFDTAMRDIAGVREVDIDRALAGGGGAFTSLPAYLYMLAVDAMGWPVFASAVVGAAWLLATDWRRALVLLVFPGAYLVFIAHTVPMSRYLNCMLPAVAVLAGFTIVNVLRNLVSGRSAIALVVAVLASIPAVIMSVDAVEFYGQTDTRSLAGAFIEREVPPGSSILIQPYSAPIHRSRESLVEALRANLGSEVRGSVKFQLEMAIAPPLTPAYRTIYYGDGGMDADKIYVLPSEFDQVASLEPLRRRGVAYVVLKKSNASNPETVRLEAALAREARRLATFSPYRSDASAEEVARTPPFVHNSSIRIGSRPREAGPNCRCVASRVTTVSETDV